MPNFTDVDTAREHLVDRLGNPDPVDFFGAATMLARVVAVLESARYPDRPRAVVLSDVTDDDVAAAVTVLPELRGLLDLVEYDLTGVARERGILPAVDTAR